MTAPAWSNPQQAMGKSSLKALGQGNVGRVPPEGSINISHSAQVMPVENDLHTPIPQVRKLRSGWSELP